MMHLAIIIQLKLVITVPSISDRIVRIKFFFLQMKEIFPGNDFKKEIETPCN